MAASGKVDRHTLPKLWGRSQHPKLCVAIAESSDPKAIDGHSAMVTGSSQQKRVSEGKGVSDCRTDARIETGKKSRLVAWHCGPCSPQTRVSVPNDL